MNKKFLVTLGTINLASSLNVIEIQQLLSPFGLLIYLSIEKSLYGIWAFKTSISIQSSVIEQRNSILNSVWKIMINKLFSCNGQWQSDNNGVSPFACKIRAMTLHRPWKLILSLNPLSSRRCNYSDLNVQTTMVSRIR